MKLVIAEKASLAEAISQAVGEGGKKINSNTIRNKDYYISFLAGHILEHYQPEDYDEKYKKWREEDLPIYFENWKKKVSKDKKEIFNNVKALLQDKNVECVINAGDMDAEGQLLVDEVLSYCKNTLPVYRVNTADTTKEKLRESLNNLEKNEKYKGLSLSAEARGQADMIFGFSFTRLFTLRTEKKVAVGRVKTPTLDLVVKRDREIENFKPKKYTTLYFDSNKDGKKTKVKVELPDDDEFLDENGYLSSPERVEELKKLIDGNNFSGEVIVKREKETPPLPFNLQTLQLLMEKRYGYSPTATMDITQNLRDKYNAISYNRSECEFVPESYYREKDKMIKRVLENTKNHFSFKEEKDYKSKCFNDSKIQLHFGIIPQDVSVNIDEFSEKEKNCYIEICRRFLEQFAGDAECEKKKLVVDFKKERKGIANSKKYLALKWKGLESVSDEDDDEKKEELVDIPFEEGSGVYLENNPVAIQRETKPPKRYTQASLIKDMTRISRFVKDERIKALLLAKDKDKTGDKGSIGTTATRDSIITLMIKQKFLDVKGKNIISTSLAREFIDILPESVKAIDTTALWYAIQEKIENGEASVDTLCQDVISNFLSVMKNDKINYSIGGNMESENKNEKKENEVFETKSSYCLKQENGKIRSIFKENKYFDSLGFKAKKSDFEKLLKTGVLKKVKLTSKAGKEYEANIKVSFEEKEGSDFLNSKFQLEFPEEKKS